MISMVRWSALPPLVVSVALSWWILTLPTGLAPIGFPMVAGFRLAQWYGISCLDFQAR